MKLQGENIVIIGGSSGVGFATAKLALKEGANVTIASRSSEKLAKAKSNLGNSNVQTVVADISNEKSIQGIFEQLDCVNHVFISASTMSSGKILDTHPDEFRLGLEERIFGTLYVIRAVFSKMPKNSSITLVSAISVDHPIPGITMTTVGVSATRTLTRCLALELAPIRVNAVSLGWIDTPLVRNLLKDRYDEIIPLITEQIPVNRIGKPEEVAEAVIMLMTNGYINGEILNITGGEHITGGEANMKILEELR